MLLQEILGMDLTRFITVYIAQGVVFVVLMNFITNYCAIFGSVFLIIFELILLKSEKVITQNKQVMITIIYGIIEFGMFFLLFNPEWGVVMNAGTDWKPVWMLPTYLYVMVFLTFCALIPLLYLAFKISKQFEDAQLKKKWNFFIIGVIFLVSFMYLIFTSNFINNSSFRTSMGAIGLIINLFGGVLVYYGVGRQIEK
jgi:hypothetical protein